ncbi:hypothetical protein GCM10028805_25340 [Spirosoma harenae]
MKPLNLIFLSLLLTLDVFRSRADVIPDGQQGVDYCVRINNMVQYSGYVFLTYEAFHGRSYQIIQPQKCIPFYRLAPPVICAIAKEKFSEEAIKSDRLEGSEKSEKKLEHYFEENPDMLRSSVKISGIFTREEADPVRVIEDILTIKKIGNDGLVIAYDSVKYSYVDGTIEQKPYLNQNERPEPSQKPDRNYTSSTEPDLNWLAVGSVAVMGLLSVLYLRSRKR